MQQPTNEGDEQPIHVPTATHSQQRGILVSQVHASVDERKDWTLQEPHIPL